MGKKVKKDILFLCQFFYPETVSSATLPFDTAASLVKSGFSVGALCGYPKEYASEKNVPKTEVKDGVEIRRVKYIQRSRVGSIGRLVNYFSFTFKTFLNLGKIKKYKSVIVYSNPPILPIVPILAKKWYGTKLVFVSYDVYPEIAYASGSIAEGSLIDRVMRKINRSLYQNADAVVTLSDEMKRFLLQHREGLSEERVFTIENWAHEKESLAPTKESYEKFGFKEDQFIVGYFGNLGTCQDIDTLLHTALALKDDRRFGFLIVGHGNKKERTKEFVAQNRLENVKVFDFLVGDEFKAAVAISRCSVVSLEKGLLGTCAPSKYYSCLLGGHPVVALVEEGSYLAEEVETERIGFHVANGDAESFCEKLSRMADDPEEVQRMSERARRLYEEKYHIDKAMEKYTNVFKTIL